MRTPVSPCHACAGSRDGGPEPAERDPMRLPLTTFFYDAAADSPVHDPPCNGPTGEPPGAKVKRCSPRHVPNRRTAAGSAATPKPPSGWPGP